MSLTEKNEGVRWWSRIRTRMGMSYVGVTLLIVLLLEAMALTAGFLIFTYSPFMGWMALERSGQAAQVFALQAAVQADGSNLNPATTFEPGQVTSLSLRQENDPPQLDWFHADVSYIAPGGNPPERPAFALLIGPDERVIASSHPEQYPVGTDAAQILPRDITLIRRALQGTTDGDMTDTDQGRLAAVARTVWSREREPIGAVYVRSPASGPPDTNLVGDVLTVLIPSGMFWLCLMLPIGLVFGVLTTRGMIRRIERLASATERFTQGDFSQRVPVSRADEIGQLESRFNGMAEQLVESFEQRQTLAEQSARREERLRIEQELSTARYIQQSLLPEQVPAIQGWQIEPYYRPARQVGGDLYDFLPLPDGRLGIVIGDVTGKGMPAALIMATTCAMVRAAGRGAVSPGEVLALVNNLLEVHISPGMFATCFYAILDPASGQLCYANAGHDIPYLARGGEVIQLRATGMPLGLMRDQSYPELQMTVQRDDSILFYTDGLVEAHNPTGEMFGFPRLQELLKVHANGDGVIHHLLNDLQHFTGADWDQEDDITLLVVRRNGA